MIVLDIILYINIPVQTFLSELKETKQFKLLSNLKRYRKFKLKKYYLLDRKDNYYET